MCLGTRLTAVLLLVIGIGGGVLVGLGVLRQTAATGPPPDAPTTVTATADPTGTAGTGTAGKAGTAGTAGTGGPRSTASPPPDTDVTSGGATGDARPDAPAPRPTPAALVRDPLLLLTRPALQVPGDAAADHTPPGHGYDGAAALADRLADVVDATAADLDAAIGVSVVDARGRTVFARRGDDRLLPASTNKLLVAAAALRTLGPDQRLTTALAATAAPDAEGVVHGDLLLVGGGDPALASPEYARAVYPARPHTPITRLADLVESAGITAVTGRVLAEPGLFAHELEPAGWHAGYLRTLDGTYTDGLTVDGGRRLFVRDGMLRGAPAEEPAVTAAAVLTDLLADRGITVARPAALAGPERPAPGVRSGAEVLGVVHSAPVSELLTHMVRFSDNQMADTLFRLVGAAAGRSGWSGAEAAVRAALDPLGLPLDGLAMADGSGLSREDRVTPELLARLDAAMYATDQAGAWRALMAVAGESGTLRRRYAGTPADGTVHGKTGALRDVRALAGSVVGPGAAPRLHFAVVGNGLRGAEFAAFRRVMDLVVLTLAADVHGCGGWRAAVPAGRGVPGSGHGPDDGARGGSPAPEDLVCAA